MSKIGIVILNYNDYETTNSFVNKIINYKVIDKILVVDNKSSDDSYKKLQRLKNDHIDVVCSDKNKGYAYGNNYGVKYLEKKYKDIDYIIISNPDIIVDEKDIEKLKKDLDENQNISVVAPVIHEYNKIIRGWKEPTYLQELCLNMNYFHKFATKSMQYKDDYYTGTLTRVEVVHGCFFMIRLKDFKKVDYFDEGTFLYYEENILARKLKNNNMLTYVDLDTNIIHNYSVSVSKSINNIKRYKILKDSQKYYEVKYNKINFLKLAILRLFYYISLGVSYIIYLFGHKWLKREK